MAETVVVSGDEIVVTIAKFQSNIKKNWCACVDSSIPAFSMSDAIKRGYIDAMKRNVKIRYITEITTDNLLHCKELLQFAELRHLTGVRGSFAVSEGEFVAGISLGGQIMRLIYSNVAEVVTHQHNVFEMLWTVAISAEAKMKELS